MLKKALVGAGLALALGISSASADVTVRVLHVQNNTDTQALWDQIARDFEKANPDVTVDVQYLENEAFKAKLTTLLQSEEKPDIIYSWAGGVMDAQIEAGFIEDITDGAAEFNDRLAPAGVNGYIRDGKQYGIPLQLSQVALFYNKPLLAKAGVDPESMRTWDGFLAGVKKIKEAGMTPIMIGGGEKWPVHFYWSYLVMRLGGPDVLNDARAGEDGGFLNPVFVEAGERLQELAELEPFQEGWLGTGHSESNGLFGDGKAVMDLMGSWIISGQKQFAADGKGIADEDLGMLPFPELPGGKGKVSDTLGGLQGFLVTEGAPKEAVDFLDFFSQAEYQRVAAEKGAYIPAVLGTDTAFANPVFVTLAGNILNSSWHQNFFDQDLGPSVGRVVNDVSTAIAAGQMSPEEGAQQVQDAWDQR